MGTSIGVVTARSIMRKPPADQWNLDHLKAFLGPPWEPVPEGEVNQDAAPRAVAIKPVLEENLPSPAQPQDDQSIAHRRVYIFAERSVEI
eukprot:9236900-Pyramimonas_sp.AAC.1